MPGSPPTSSSPRRRVLSSASTSGPPELPGSMFASCSITESTDAQLVSPAAFGLRHDAAGERVLGIAEREASDTHLEAGIDLAVVPVEERIAVALRDR